MLFHLSFIFVEMFAIVDIETTGSFAAENGITEIAIVLFNGKEVEKRFTTLIQPQYPIPKFVSQLTGITNAMVAHAPLFADVAADVFRMLQNRIFVAHNVNFDYSFIKYHLKACGYEWNARKLCTLKLAREAFPGFPKYGLGSICRQLDISIENRHRAGGDADATCILFDRILQKGGTAILKTFFKKENRAQILPPNLPMEAIQRLPNTPGVYHFHNKKDKIIYTGKAKSLKTRVAGHFTGFTTSSRRQEFLRNIFSISFIHCPTELQAAILESIEIRKRWPQYNISQKHREQAFGIFSFEDAKGYWRLAIDKINKQAKAIATYPLFSEAHNALWKLVRAHDLDARMCFLDRTPMDADKLPPVAEYNDRVKLAIQAVTTGFTDFLVVEKTNQKNKLSCILIEQNKFYGMGIVPSRTDLTNKIAVKKFLEQYPHNTTILSLIRAHVLKHPEQFFRMENTGVMVE